VVEIKGIENFAPKDFPGYISATLFTGGCNFRCPYCHNADLVLRPDSLSTFPLSFLLNFLDVRQEWLEAVCVSGGEPLMHEDIAGIFQVLKDRNFLTKLDTNGSFPERLRSLIEEGLLDHVALDIKAPLERYREVTGYKGGLEAIQASIEVIRDSGIDHMFRTTVVPGLHDAQDIRKIGEWLGTGDRFCVQQFSPGNTIDEAYRERKAYSQEQMQEFAALAEKYFSEVILEGV
jgi:pyruvate formate lyase activating enzyme